MIRFLLSLLLLFPPSSYIIGPLELPFVMSLLCLFICFFFLVEKESELWIRTAFTTCNLSDLGQVI